jgi:urease accessory protein
MLVAVLNEADNAELTGPYPRARAEARGCLHFVRNENRTVTARSAATSPLRILSPDSPGDAAWVYTSTFGGGLLSGDHIFLEINVGVHAAAYVTTQSATKVFRSTTPDSTVQTTTATVGDDALLAFLPDPVSCFAGARYRQEQRFNLAAKGNLVLLDWFTSGRHARGEQWAAEYHSSNEIRIAGHCLIRDRLRLDSPARSLGMGAFNCIATLILAGPLLEPQSKALITHIDAAPFRHGDRSPIAASPLGGGIIIRAAGVNAEAVAAKLFPFLEFLRPVLGELPWRRKW